MPENTKQLSVSGTEKMYFQSRSGSGSLIINFDEDLYMNSQIVEDILKQWYSDTMGKEPLFSTSITDLMPK